MTVLDAASVGQPSSYVAVYDVATGGAERITTEGFERFEVWSPDGTEIAYLRARCVLHRKRSGEFGRAARVEAGQLLWRDIRKALMSPRK
jgi:Tol biopolymer transport system component